jgi:putative methionine-R-sulfoxide reductase with GAF domain
MFTPVRAKGQSFGMLSVDHPTPGAFDDNHLSLLNVLAGSLGTGMAIDKAAGGS